MSLFWRASSLFGLVVVCACIGIFWSLAQKLFDFRDIFSFVSDVLSSGIWLEAASLTDSSLSDMIPGLIDLQLGAKAASTVLKYKSGWLR